MSAFDLDASVQRARQRFTARGPAKARSDRGRSRLAPQVEAALHQLLDTQERPQLSAVKRQLDVECRRRKLPAPSRATLYNALERVAPRNYPWAELPDEVTRAMYNACSDHGLDTPDQVRGDQIVFYAFNYGSTRAISFASGLPWLCLVRAAEQRGFRPKSRALLKAVMKYRGL